MMRCKQYILTSTWKAPCCGSTTSLLLTSLGMYLIGHNSYIHSTRLAVNGYGNRVQTQFIGETRCLFYVHMYNKESVEVT